MESWDDIKEQLERYGGAPNDAIIPVLRLLADMNDDIEHMRSPEIIWTDYRQIKEALYVAAQNGETS